MGRYFGTDGVRGKANEVLKVETAFTIGRFLGHYFDTSVNGPIIIGKDTRLSGDMFESALAAGASASGADVVLLGVCPTPSIIYFVTHCKFSCGVMISASHNPFYDNGIKVINSDGTKLAGKAEEELEDYMDGKYEIAYAPNDKIGKVNRESSLLDQYLDHLLENFKMDLSDYKVFLDLTNGSATSSAVKVLTKLKANITYINNEPTGTNINFKCGSTHPEMMIENMKSGKYDIGLAFDGDADRLIACDDKGELIDGDKVLYIIGTYLDSKALLKDHVVVTTVMSNLGLYKAFDKVNIKYEKTAVGDKNVFECMMNNDYKLGGEQSGHTIIKDYACTGDGLQTGLMLLKIMKETGKTSSELASPVKIYPQLLVNVTVKDKKAAQEDADVVNKVNEIAKRLGDNGRILVRPSGTEPLIRVMVEAENDQICHDYVYEVIDIIQAKGL